MKLKTKKALILNRDYTHAKKWLLSTNSIKKKCKNLKKQLKRLIRHSKKNIINSEL